MTNFELNVERQLKWDFRFLDMAKLVASWSKDPSTKTGAVIVAPDLRVLSVGFNGFPRGMLDHPHLLNDREKKYQIIIHCERNAMLFCREPLAGSTLYTYPFISCGACASMLIQSGIVRHVAPRSKHPRFGEEHQPTIQMLAECGVDVTLLDYPTDDNS